MAVPLGDAIKNALDGRSQRWLADELGIEQSSLTRILTGQRKDVPVDLVAQMEEVLGLARGALLRAAGYVDDVLTPEDALRQDTSLPRSLRDAYIAGIEATRRAHGADPGDEPS